MAGEQHGNYMACVNQSRLHYVNQVGKTQCILLAARHGMGTAWKRHGNCMGTAWERHENDMVCVNQSRPLYLNQMVKTQSTLLAAWHGMGMAWERHGMCETITAALCKSNGKDILYTFSGTTWQGNGMETALERHGNGMVCVN
jgi:hypothetical protein